jgi:hypothetical protein
MTEEDYRRLQAQLPAWARGLPIRNATNDRDLPFDFGRQPSSAQPGPFTSAQFARLLVLRRDVRRGVRSA